MGNFDFLLNQPIFNSFSRLAADAERIAISSPAICIMSCRRAAEVATKWLYAVDKSLKSLPNSENRQFFDLITYRPFQQLVGKEINDQLNFVRKAGNLAAHQTTQFTQGDAIQILKSLYFYLDWIDQMYGNGQSFHRFSRDLILRQAGIDPSRLTSRTVASGSMKLVHGQQTQKTDPPPSSGSTAAAPTHAKTSNQHPTANTATTAAKAAATATAESSINAKAFLAPAPGTAQTEARTQETADKLKQENERLIAELNKLKAERAQYYQKPQSDISEEETRKYYIDVQLRDAGWKKGKDWIDEYQVDGMPTATGIGYADYVLFDNDGSPLAIIEAKRTSVDPAQGRKQANLYADSLERKFGVRPAIFLTNGLEITLQYGNEPDRRVSTFFTKSDLQVLRFNQRHRQPLKDIKLDERCRYYQKDAINAVCRHFSDGFRKALLVMATGSGKTLTVLNLIKVLCEKGWVKNVLFLADRTALVSQAFASAKQSLSAYTITNLCAQKWRDLDPSARIVFSTYQTMIGKIDAERTESGARLFSPAHFNLIICDEAHRSIYNKYHEIFNYFDAYLVGLTATPKDDIDINTYRIFALMDGDPTYYYSLKQAVSDGYLVDYTKIDVETGVNLNGLTKDSLPEKEQELWDETFADLADENGFIPNAFSSGAIDRWLFNKDTIALVLDKLMTCGIKIENETKIGKTIIFARNHRHAEVIRQVFLKEYPRYGSDFCQVIDNQIKYCDEIIEAFKDPNKMPQIAVSVDMMDTGIDVPECLNLLFYKQVFSYAKFWQMIGRGTRKCPGLLDGKDKHGFLIIDACKNFEFFKLNPKGHPINAPKSLTHLTFEVRLNILKTLQDQRRNGQLTAEDEKYIQHTVSDLVDAVKQIPRVSHQGLNHQRALHEYTQESTFKLLTQQKVTDASNELGAIIPPNTQDDISARRFDYLIYGLQLHVLCGAKNRTAFGKLIKKLKDIAVDLQSKQDDIPDIKQQRAYIDSILSADFKIQLTLPLLENIREHLRLLCVYLDKEPEAYKIVDFSDEITQVSISTGGLAEDFDDSAFEPYRKRFEKYVNGHKNDGVIGKLFNNIPLSQNDKERLQQIAWQEIGSLHEYEKDFAQQNLGFTVRSIAGLNETAASQLFADLKQKLNPLQTSFVDKVIGFVVKNGLIADKQVLTQTPFDRPSISTAFAQHPDNLKAMLSKLDELKQNADVAIPNSKPE